jgi:hypothetical protein
MNEPMQDGLRDALRRLREETAGQCAPAAMESDLAQAFRDHHRVKRAQRKWMWIPAAIAASLAIGFALRVSEPEKLEKASVPVAAKSKPPVTIETTAPLVPVAAKKRQPPTTKVRPPRVRRPLSLAATKPRPQQEEEPFVQIPYAPPFTLYDEGQILRVNMTGSSVRRMGIPVAAQQVQADLLVGNDGLPRAVRLVSHSSSSY